jgi:hypothetical protein
MPFSGRPYLGQFYIQNENQDLWLYERVNGIPQWVRKGNIRDEGTSGLVGIQPILSQGFNMGLTLQRIRYLDPTFHSAGFGMDVLELQRIRLLTAAFDFGLGMSPPPIVDRVVALNVMMALGFNEAAAVHLTAGVDLSVNMQLGFSEAAAIQRIRQLSVNMGLGFSEAAAIQRIRFLTASMALGSSQSNTLNHAAAPKFLVESDNASPFVRWLDSSLTKISDPATIPTTLVQAADISSSFTAVATPSTLLIYDMTSGAPVKVTGPASPPAWSNIVKLQFSPDGSKLMVIDNTVSPFVWVYNTSTWTTVTAPNPGRAVQQAVWSPDGSKIALGCMSSSFLSIYNASTGALITSPATQPVATVRGLAWSPDGNHLAMADASNAFIVYRTDTWAKLADPATMPSGSVSSLGNVLAISPDSSKIALGTNGTPFLWVYSLNAAAHTLTYIAAPATLPTAQVRALAFKADGSALFVGFQNTVSPRLYSYNTSTWAKNTDPVTQPGTNPFALASTL